MKEERSLKAFRVAGKNPSIILWERTIWLSERFYFVGLCPMSARARIFGTIQNVNTECIALWGLFCLS